MSQHIGAGTIFRLKEQKLNDFSVGEEEVGEKPSKQSNSKYNFTQYVCFEKKLYAAQRGLEQSPRSWEFLRIFVSKVTLR